MKKVLIPTDFTLFSLGFIKYALHLLKGEPCQIILVHLVPLPDSITELLTLPREADEAAEPNTPFANGLERIKKLHPLEIVDVRIAKVYCDNSLHIAQFVRKNRVDLVLSPVPVASASECFSLFNSFAKDVPCPVLYIPEFFEINKFRKIAFVLNANERATVLPDKALIELLCRNEYHFTILLVSKPRTAPDALKRTLDTLYAAPALKDVVYSIHLIHERDVTSGVVAFTEEFALDLVVTCKKRSVLSFLQLDKSSRLRDQALHSKVPCLAVE